MESIVPWFSTQNAGSAIAQGAKFPPTKKRRGAPTGQGRKSEISDQVVREIRALYDFKKWKPDALCKRYGLSQDQVKRIISGYTAAYVLHSEADLPL